LVIDQSWSLTRARHRGSSVRRARTYNVFLAMLFQTGRVRLVCRPTSGSGGLGPCFRDPKQRRQQAAPSAAPSTMTAHMTAADVEPASNMAAVKAMAMEAVAVEAVMPMEAMAVQPVPTPVPARIDDHAAMMESRAAIRPAPVGRPVMAPPGPAMHIVQHARLLNRRSECARICRRCGLCGTRPHHGRRASGDQTRLSHRSSLVLYSHHSRPHRCVVIRAPRSPFRRRRICNVGEAPFTMRCRKFV
jgi:hypothetical protein